MEQRKVVSHFLRYLRIVWLPFSVSLLLLFIAAGLTGAKAWIIQPVVDAFLKGTTTRSNLILLCLLVAAIFVSQALFMFFYTVTARLASANIVRRIRSDLFSHLSRQSLSYFSDRSSGELTSRVVNDVAAFEHVAVESLQNLLRDLVTIGMLVCVLLLKEWRLAVSCLVILGAVALLLHRMSGRVALLGRKDQEMIGKLNHQMTEMISGIGLILSLGLAKSWQRRFGDINSEHFQIKIQAARTSSLAVMGTNLIVGLGISVILFVTGYALITERISAGDFGSFLGAIYLMQVPASNLGYSVANLSRGMAAANRALTLLEQSPTIIDPPSPRGLPDGRLELEFEGVGFGYKDRTPILKDLSFRVEPGELVVMVGDSGAGKSTVARLLMRFYDPDVGEVRVGQVPLHELARKELYHSVGYVAQDIFLFDGTIEFNLMIGHPSASAEQTAEVLRIASLEDFLAEMPEGVETVVGERGKQLSGGQRQRLAIARALLTSPRVLILDEATSALDVELERRILQNLVDDTRSRTIFAVSHRLSLADIADRVLVLKQGQLVEQGATRTLARKNGEFARLKRAARQRLVREPRSPADQKVPHTSSRTV